MSLLHSPLGKNSLASPDLKDIHHIYLDIRWLHPLQNSIFRKICTQNSFKFIFIETLYQCLVNCVAQDTCKFLIWLIFHQVKQSQFIAFRTYTSLPQQWAVRQVQVTLAVLSHNLLHQWMAVSEQETEGYCLPGF